MRTSSHRVDRPPAGLDPTSGSECLHPGSWAARAASRERGSTIRVSDRCIQAIFATTCTDSCAVRTSWPWGGRGSAPCPALPRDRPQRLGRDDDRRREAPRPPVADREAGRDGDRCRAGG